MIKKYSSPLAVGVQKGNMPEGGIPTQVSVCDSNLMNASISEAKINYYCAQGALLQFVKAASAQFDVLLLQ